MKSAWRLAAATAVSMAVASMAAAAAPPAATPAKTAPAKAAGPSDRAQIEALERGFAAAFNAKSVDRVMSYYARDGLFVFDVGTPREHDGWESYRKDWEGLFGMFPGLHFAISDLAITVVGPVAWSHCIQSATYTGKDGAKTDLVVRVTDVYRKTGGRGKIVQELVSVPVDFATGKPDMLSKP